MDLRAELRAAADDPQHDRRRLYRLLAQSTLHVRTPMNRWVVTNPETGGRAVPVFLSSEEATRFWSLIGPEGTISVGAVSLPEVAEQAVGIGAVVVEPGDAGVVIDRGALKQLAAGEIPGEFAAWMRDLGQLGRHPDEVLARLKRTHVFVLTGRAEGEDQRLYLLTKSEDGTTAVPCFSGRETIAQFSQVRRLFEGTQAYGVALYRGDECLRVAASLGAYVLIDPESPWETQLEPPLPGPGLRPN